MLGDDGDVWVAVRKEMVVKCIDIGFVVSVGGFSDVQTVLLHCKLNIQHSMVIVVGYISQCSSKFKYVLASSTSYDYWCNFGQDIES